MKWQDIFWFWKQGAPPRCKCGNDCQHYGLVGGYSVQCENCNKRQSSQRRAASARRRAQKGADSTETIIANLQLNHFKVESDIRAWRCGECSKMQDANRVRVWFPDGYSRHDSPSVVFDALKRMRWNGEFTAWCLDCAKKFSETPSHHRSDTSGFTLAPGESKTVEFTIPLPPE